MPLANGVITIGIVGDENQLLRVTKQLNDHIRPVIVVTGSCGACAFSSLDVVAHYIYARLMPSIADGNTLVIQNNYFLQDEILQPDKADATKQIETHLQYIHTIHHTFPNIPKSSFS